MKLSRRHFTKQGLLWLASGPAILKAQDVSPTRRLNFRSSAALAVADWVARVQTNGGAKPSQATINAVTTWYNGLVTDGINTSILSCTFFAPDNLIAAITPFFKSVGNDPYTNNGFVSGDISTSGLTSSGASPTKYLATGINPRTAFANDNSAGVSVGFVSQNGSTGSDYGCTFGGDDATTQWQYYCDWNQTNRWWDCWSASTNRVDFTGTFSPVNAAFYSGNRVSSTDSRVYAFSTGGGFSFAQLGATQTTAAAVRPNHTAILYGLDNNGSIIQRSAYCLSFFAVHLGLSSAQAQSLLNRTQTLRTAFGGGTY